MGMKKQKLIIGNWKMNPENMKVAKQIFQKIKTKAGKFKKAKCVICPPFIYLDAFAKAHGTCAIGAQDAFWEESGARTGEISASMISKLNVPYVILGHSERRELGDTNEIVNKKVIEALRQRLMVIVCVGEKTRDEEGSYLQFLQAEIEESLAKIPARYFKNIIVAYEPIWAIGEKAKKSSTPEDFLEKAIFIRKVLTQLTDKKIAMKIPILYGGSVNDANAAGFLQEGRADGLLIGRASRDPQIFGEILKTAHNV